MDNPFLMKLNQSGATLLVVTALIAVVLILLSVLLTKLESEFSASAITYHGLQALNIAEAGVEKAIYELNRTNGTYQGETKTSLGNGIFTVKVQPGSSGRYRIISIGETRTNNRYAVKKNISALVERTTGRWRIVSWQEN